jgi:hypothetical protein
MLADLSDPQLVVATAHAIVNPKTARASSFTLHAPMELLARAALLPLTPLPSRDLMRLRIALIAAEYAEGEEIPRPVPAFSSEREAVEALISALRGADPDLADLAITSLADNMSVHDICAVLADEIAPCLGAAAHVPILLAGLPDACASFGNLSGLLRAPIRALAAEGRARLTWQGTVEASKDGPDSLFEALAHPPHVASPHIFIVPTMLSVEANGFAASLLGKATQNLSADSARRELSRLAALAMLQDDPEQAPYGWSHCLTMPRGALALADYARDPSRGVRAAATYVLGFRATLGKVRLQEDLTLEPQLNVASLVARAASYPDAHLAKYTHACLISAAEDPPSRALFLAAADFLGNWWDANPGAEFKV